MVVTCHIKKLVVADVLRTSGSSWQRSDLLMICEKDLPDVTTTLACSWHLKRLFVVDVPCASTPDHSGSLLSWPCHDPNMAQEKPIVQFAIEPSQAQASSIQVPIGNWRRYRRNRIRIGSGSSPSCSSTAAMSHATVTSQVATRALTAELCCWR
jgi:hypothetical protein